jgi:hypothetical protein
MTAENTSKDERHFNAVATEIDLRRIEGQMTGRNATVRLVPIDILHVKA